MYLSHFIACTIVVLPVQRGPYIQVLQVNVYTMWGNGGALRGLVLVKPQTPDLQKAGSQTNVNLLNY